MLFVCEGARGGSRRRANCVCRVIRGRPPPPHHAPCHCVPPALLPASTGKPQARLRTAAPHVRAATSGTTTSMPVKMALSPGRTPSTWSLRSTTSIVRGREPAGTCRGQQWPPLGRVSPHVGSTAQGPWFVGKASPLHTPPQHGSHPGRPLRATLRLWEGSTRAACWACWAPLPHTHAHARAPRLGSPAPWPSASPQRWTTPSPATRRCCTRQRGRR